MTVNHNAHKNMLKKMTLKTNFIVAGIVIGAFIGVSIEHVMGQGETIRTEGGYMNLSSVATGVAFNTAAVNENGLTIANGNLLVPNGKIGIRTASPLADLDVNGTTLLRNNTVIGGTSDPAGSGSKLTVIGKLNATEGLCIGTTCITAAQLATAIAGGGGSPAPAGAMSCPSFNFTQTSGNCSTDTKNKIIADCCQGGNVSQFTSCTVSSPNNGTGGEVATYTGPNCNAPAPIKHLGAATGPVTVYVPTSIYAYGYSSWQGTAKAVGSTCTSNNVYHTGEVTATQPECGNNGVSGTACLKANEYTQPCN